MLDALKAGAVVRHDDGVVVQPWSRSPNSSARASRSGANRDVEQWIAMVRLGRRALRRWRQHRRAGRCGPRAPTVGACRCSRSSRRPTPTRRWCATSSSNGARRRGHAAACGAARRNGPPAACIARARAPGTALHAVGEALDYRRQPFTPVAVESILAFRLDDLVPLLGLPLPTRLKLDVDGFEHKVLDGAAGCWRRRGATCTSSWWRPLPAIRTWRR